MQNIVSFWSLNRKRLTRFQENTYVFTPVGRFKWLKQKVFDLLIETKCLNNSIVEDEVVQRIDVNLDLAAQALIKDIRHFEYHYGKKPTQLLIGPEEMSEFYYNQRTIRPDEFYLGGYVDITKNGDQKFFGINIKVVPHMKGYIFI